MAIIARRIFPSGLGYVSAHTVPAYTVRGGLGGSGNCGSNQQWDPNYVFNGIKGQCTPKGSPLVGMASGAATGVDWGKISASISSALAPKPAAQYPGGPPPSADSSSGGMSNTTMIAIGLGAAGLLALIMLTRK